LAIHQEGQLATFDRGLPDLARNDEERRRIILIPLPT
jgi:hypothetical protein